uniref:Uncharacterized protein n=1 Tax=Oncorhynchus tshawytscha TaxID=74940 RepID=A0AAZ3RQ71_ONCTS
KDLAWVPRSSKFNSCTIESILNSCITAWYGNCSASDLKALQREVRTAQYIAVAKLPGIRDLYTWRCQRKAQKIEYPTLTTFFAGEIISRKRPFLTRKWDADEDVDRKHWGKFQAFYQYAKTFNSDEFDYDELKNSDYIFMRWKEQFLVPDHTIKDISGASFAGFYYICFQKSTATIEGYYYHRSSEWYQSLNLTHVPEHSAAIYEFR